MLPHNNNNKYNDDNDYNDNNDDDNPHIATSGHSPVMWTAFK
jgi:hypothetical protein